MRIINERRSDGRNYAIIDGDPNRATEFVIARFEKLADAGAVLRYLSGCQMTDEERIIAIVALKRFDCEQQANNSQQEPTDQQKPADQQEPVINLNCR